MRLALHVLFRVPYQRACETAKDRNLRDIFRSPDAGKRRRLKLRVLASPRAWWEAIQLVKSGAAPKLNILAFTFIVPYAAIGTLFNAAQEILLSKAIRQCEELKYRAESTLQHMPAHIAERYCVSRSQPASLNSVGGVKRLALKSPTLMSPGVSAACLPAGAWQ